MFDKKVMYFNVGCVNFNVYCVLPFYVICLFDFSYSCVDDIIECLKGINKDKRKYDTIMNTCK